MKPDNQVWRSPPSYPSTVFVYSLIHLLYVALDEIAANHKTLMMIILSNIRWKLPAEMVPTRNHRWRNQMAISDVFPPQEKPLHYSMRTHC